MNEFVVRKTVERNFRYLILWWRRKWG